MLTNVLQEQRRQAKAREEEQSRQAEAREEKLIQALIKLGNDKYWCNISCSTRKYSKFTAFDANVELWKYNLARFTTFVQANSIPAEKTA